MAFSSLHLNEQVLQAIADAGYREPTPIQQQAMPEILAGRDLIGIAQTGTGKTAAFTWPILSLLAQRAYQGKRCTRALIIAPTRELVVQIEENIIAYGKHLPFRIGKIFGGVSEKPQLGHLRAGAEIIVATPGRLLDLLSRPAGDLRNLEFLVLDEADRMLDMGFLPDIRRIVERLPRRRQTLLFSASLSREIEGLTHEFMSDPKLVQIGRRANPAETVAQSLYEIEHREKLPLLVHLLNNPDMDMVLVFSRTKYGTEKLAKHLDREGISNDTLHSNRSQAQRLQALNDFKDGKIRLLLATDIASRGIDVDGISHVINYDFPEHPEDYVHRIGRTGRAEQVGDAISFVTREERGALRAVEKFIGQSIPRVATDGLEFTPLRPAEKKGSEPQAPKGTPRRHDAERRAEVKHEHTRRKWKRNFSPNKNFFPKNEDSKKGSGFRSPKPEGDNRKEQRPVGSHFGNSAPSDEKKPFSPFRKKRNFSGGRSFRSNSSPDRAEKPARSDSPNSHGKKFFTSAKRKNSPKPFGNFRGKKKRER